MDLNTPDEAIRSTQVNGLFLLPAGTPDLNPASLLANGRTQALLETLAREYDCVLLDCPPVLVAADAAILGTAADAVLLILRAGHTDRHNAQDALHQLDTVGARVVGGVLNATKVHHYDAYKEYRYYGRHTGGG
jgi:receptor protein-tyrosine kinase